MLFLLTKKGGQGIKKEKEKRSHHAKINGNDKFIDNTDIRNVGEVSTLCDINGPAFITKAYGNLLITSFTGKQIHVVSKEGREGGINKKQNKAQTFHDLFIT